MELRLPWSLIARRGYVGTKVRNRGGHNNKTFPFSLVSEHVNPSFKQTIPIDRKQTEWILWSTTDVRGANTFPLRNRHPYLSLGCETIRFSLSGLPSVLLSLFGINNTGGDSVVQRVYLSAILSRLYLDWKIPGATAGDSAGDCDRPMLVHP